MSLHLVSGANLKPVSWEQGGTFGYTETFKLLTYPSIATFPQIEQGNRY